jgi:hypothetical protein
MSRRLGPSSLVVLVAAAATFGSAATAKAEEQCVLDLTSQDFICTIILHERPGGPPLDVDLDGPGGLPIVWSRVSSNGLPGATFTCYYEEVNGTETTQVFGVGWAIIITNTDTGEVRLADFVCEYPGEDPPQPPPPPPDVDQMVRDQRRVFELDTGLSPPVERRGVSQLETWFWCDYDAPRDLILSLGGYEIDATVDVVSVTWTIDGPDGLIERTATDCGAEPAVRSTGADAAATWTPNEPGDHRIQLTARWEGVWSLGYVDPAFGVVDLGVFDLGSVDVAAAAFDYSVYEIQTVGVAP